MAPQSVATMEENETFPAMTKLGDDMQWELLDDRLPSGVWRRLMTAKRSLYAMNVLNSMLFKDSLGKADKEDSGATYDGLSSVDVEALRVAVIELGERAEHFLTEVQSNAYGCCGPRRS